MANRRSDNIVVSFVVIAWAALLIILNIRRLFVTDPTTPPLLLMISVVGPPILFGVAYTLSAKIRSLALGLDLRLITAIQAWRVIGGTFLVLMVYGLLPGTFAWPAGVGDMIVGVMRLSWSLQ